MPRPPGREGNGSGDDAAQGAQGDVDHVADEPDEAGLLFARLRLGPHRNLVYLVADPTRGEAAVIDPAFDVPRILQVAENWDAQIKHAFFTHHHADHTEGAHALHATTGCLLHAHAADAAEIESKGVPITRLRGGDAIPLGGKTILAHHTPGHTAGGVTYQAGRRLFTGDFLFIGTSGRTDFPGGSKHAMWESLQHFKGRFPDHALICPGHHYGATPEATLGEQKQDNPALAHTRYEDFEKEWFLVAY